MQIEEIQSHKKLLEKLENNKKLYLLLFKKGSEQSDCSFNNLSKLEEKDIPMILSADVSQVRDIHEKYFITSVPTLLEFEEKAFKNSIKGCHDVNYYKTLFQNAVFISNAGGDVKPQKRVTVYSTPTCRYCTIIKEHFNKHNIKFRDIDISKDQKAAEDLVKRSGQQGVPQTEINGQIIVGFDKAKLNQLLDIKE